MTHPLLEDTRHLKNEEIERKITTLTNKYFMTSNVQLREQIKLLLDEYKEIMYLRNQQELHDAMSNKDLDLENLINVN